MATLRPPYQLELDLPIPGRGEAPRREAREVEVVEATAEPESPASTQHLMEAICAPDNIKSGVGSGGAQQGGARHRRYHRQTTAEHLQRALVGDQRPTASGALPTATGTSGENPETGGRDAQPRHSKRSRSRDSAGNPAATPTAVGPDIQQAQLRLSAGPLRTSGGDAGASLRHRRLSLRRRY